MVSVRAGTIEFVYSFVDEIRPAGTTVLTRIPLATNEFHRAIFPAVFRLASARVIGSTIDAYTVFARCVPFTFVDIVLTMVALITLVAFTGVATDAIHADPGLTRIAIALVDIEFAIFARDTLHAQTLVAEREIDSIIFHYSSFLRFCFIQVCVDRSNNSIFYIFPKVMKMHSLKISNRIRTECISYNG